MTMCKSITEGAHRCTGCTATRVAARAESASRALVTALDTIRAVPQTYATSTPARRRRRLREILDSIIGALTRGATARREQDYAALVALSARLEARDQRRLQTEITAASRRVDAAETNLALERVCQVNDAPELWEKKGALVKAAEKAETELELRLVELASLRNSWTPAEDRCVGTSNAFTTRHDRRVYLEGQPKSGVFVAGQDKLGGHVGMLTQLSANLRRSAETVSPGERMSRLAVAELELAAATTARDHLMLHGRAMPSVTATTRDLQAMPA
jgi:hypothetical protein